MDRTHHLKGFARPIIGNTNIVILIHYIHIHSDYVMDRDSGVPFADILCSPIHLEPVPRDTTFKSNDKQIYTTKRIK